MKKQLIYLFTVFVCINCFSQISFDKGYYIDNSGKKIECLIKNSDWKNNPVEFQYRLLNDEEVKSIKTDQIKEFGIYNESKFYRSIVNLDKSSDVTSALSDVKEPIFEEQQLLLKVLVEGKASLYQYVNGNLTRFFFKTSNGNIEQLIFKRYKPEFSTIATNSYFKKQLWDALRCKGKPLEGVQGLDYRKQQLVNLFVRYNECTDTKFNNFNKKQRSSFLNLAIRPGMSSASLEVSSTAQEFKNADFGNKLGFRIGAEVEYVLPFNSNKWAVIAEPSYYNFKAEKELNTTAGTATVDYKSFEIPFGVRHYLFLNDNSRLFLNGLLVMNFSNSKIEYEKADELRIDPNASFSIGVGYKYYRYALELRHGLRRGIIGRQVSWKSDYERVSLIFGYTLF
ncbi:tRNA modification GTPase [Snuella lapsa]|uniref:tRNA modification GTPase n=1 Tax=Snuella lapsa TaxID=870481 RepID=A0ABP6XVS0_9FLAO